MCLLTRQKRAKILKEDLYVWKNVKTVAISLDNGDESYETRSSYYFFKWTAGVVYTTNLVKGKDVTGHDPSAIDMYTYCPPNDRRKLKDGVISISCGFHASLTKHRLIKMMVVTPRQFLIPAGSRIFYDETGLCVSNKMMLL